MLPRPIRRWWYVFLLILVAPGLFLFYKEGIEPHRRIEAIEDLFHQLQIYERAGQSDSIYRELFSDSFQAKITMVSFIEDWKRQRGELGLLLDRQSQNIDCHSDSCQVSAIGNYIWGISHENYYLVKNNKKGWQVQFFHIHPLPIPKPKDLPSEIRKTVK